jgi:anthranilate/para-aminobenzoate synthase component II
MLLIVDNSNGKVTRLSNIGNFVIAFKKLNIPFVIAKDIDKTLDKSKIKGIILTGSPLKLTKNIQFDKYIHNLYYLFEYNVPVLGICFGCQILHMLYGGKLKDMEKYFCKSTEVKLSNHKLFDDIKPKKDLHFCFSDLLLPLSSDKIKELAWFNFNNKKNPCAFEYKKQKIYGLLFHPESLESSYQILNNFYNICI